MKVKRVSELVGISVRTLHYYDQIDLLKPSETTETGYRLYSQENIETLQQILFFKELNFSLKNIKTIINDGSFNRKEALMSQREMLTEKRDRYNQMIETIDKTIKDLRGEIQMTNEERFKGINFRDNPYEKEARERWGDRAVDESNEKLTKMTDQEHEELAVEWETRFTRLAEIRHESPKSDVAQEEIKKWYNFLNGFHPYSLEAFAGLGQLYIQDERFTKNIDQYGEGLAKFMCEAMKTFAEHQQENE